MALVHRRFTTNGGTERYLVGFARWLVREGHDVHVLCNEVRPDLQTEPGVTFTHLSIFRPMKLVSLWASARRALAARRFDAVMGFGRTPGHQLFRAGGGSHAEALRRTHPLGRWFSPGEWVEVALDRAAARAARVVMANSQLGAVGLRRDYGLERVEVVYNGVDLNRFSPIGREAARRELNIHGPLAVFLGTGFWRKGLDIAIAALPSGWTLLVAGAGRPVPAPNVRYVGTSAAPERLLQGADLMILPTRYDPFANACLEALACGTPVLTTSTNGASEVLPYAWMTADDVSGLSRGFDLALDGGEELRTECRARAEQFTMDRSYSRAFELLQEASR